MNSFFVVLFRVAVNVIGLGVAAIIFKNVEIKSFGVLLLAGTVLSLINILLKPMLTILAIPLLVLTLGLFYLVICAVVVLLTSWIVTGFVVNGFFTAIGVSVVVILINFIFDLLAGNRSNVYIIRR